MSYGIYIHTPFCASKCHYCDFLSFATDSDESLKEDYFNAICKEIELAKYEFHYLTNLSIDTIYFGGGTPTILPPSRINAILYTIKQNFKVLTNAEITVETNPNITIKSIMGLKIGRVNRLSFGLQSTNNEKLASLNRTHTMEDFLKTFRTARELHFNNINIDLMFALPNQDINQWCDTLETVINLSPEHISAYSLTPAEGTPLFEDIKNGLVTLPDDSIDRDMYHLACEMLQEAGYNHYELSNFAKPNFESKHNVNCWKRKPYLGFGLGAHSFINNKRWNNTTDLQCYFAVLLNIHKSHLLRCTRRELQKLSPDDAMAETMILGLRLTQGVCIDEFKETFGITPAEKYNLTPLVKDELLTIDSKYIRLTRLGMDLANQVFITF